MMLSACQAVVCKTSALIIRNVCVNQSFHHTDVGRNLGLTRNDGDFHRVCGVVVGVGVSHKT